MFRTILRAKGLSVAVKIGFGFEDGVVFGQNFSVPRNQVFLVPLLGRDNVFFDFRSGYVVMTDTVRWELEKLARIPGWIGVAAKAALGAGILWAAYGELTKAAEKDRENEKVDREECEKVGWPGDPDEELSKDPGGQDIARARVAMGWPSRQRPMA